MSAPTMRFGRNVNASMAQVSDVIDQRGSEYADTWENCRWLAMKAVARKLGIALSQDDARRLGAAAMLDIKYARLEGGYKEDTIVDLIPYAANLMAEMKEHD